MRKGLGILSVAWVILFSLAPLCDSTSWAKAACPMARCESAAIRSSHADACCCADATQPVSASGSLLKAFMAAPPILAAPAWHDAADRLPAIALPDPRPQSRPLHLLHATLLI